MLGDRGEFQKKIERMAKKKRGLVKERDEALAKVEDLQKQIKRFKAAGAKKPLGTVTVTPGGPVKVTTTPKKGKGKKKASAKKK